VIEEEEAHRGSIMVMDTSLIDWGDMVDSVLVASGTADKGTFLRRVKSGGMAGSGSLAWSLMSMSRTLDMVGRASGFSCTQSRPTW